jgi:uncharacterized protein DUF4154
VTRVTFAVLLFTASTLLGAQDVPLEYQIKAAYLLNFARFVTWPLGARPGPLSICVAVQNPFGDVLNETLRGETVQGRPLTSRVIVQPESGCHVLFVPNTASGTPFLQAARSSPTLTVGEAPNFIAQGGIINLVIEEGTVKFEISPEAAGRADLRISSHLFRLARKANEPGAP